MVGGRALGMYAFVSELGSNEFRKGIAGVGSGTCARPSPRCHLAQRIEPDKLEDGVINGRKKAGFLEFLGMEVSQKQKFFEISVVYLKLIRKNLIQQERHSRSADSGRMVVPGEVAMATLVDVEVLPVQCDR